MVLGPESAVGRRSLLRLGAMAATGAAGGLLTAGCGADGSSPGPATSSSSTTANGGTTGEPVLGSVSAGQSQQPLLTPAGFRPSTIRPTWSQQFQHGHDWKAIGEGTASSDLNDSSIVLSGSQAARVTTSGAGASSALRIIGLSPLDMTGKMIRVTFRVDDVTNLDRLIFQVGTGILDDHFTWQFHTHAKGSSYVQSGEWVVVHLQWADVTSGTGLLSLNHTGAPSTTAGFTAMAFQVYDNKQGPVTYRVQSVELVPDTRTIFPRGVVSITFDDSYASVYNLALPAMRKHGFAGTVYNIAEAADSTDHLTTAQMRRLQGDNGWEMAGHAYAKAAHNVGYNALPAAQVRDDLSRLRSWLDAHDFHSPHFAYPHGAFGQTQDGEAIDRLAAEHFATARSIVFDTAESFIPAMPYRLKSLTGVSDGTGFDATPPSVLTGSGSRLDRCAANADWLILCLHDLSATAPKSSTQIGANAFADILAAIAAHNIPVLTVGEAMKHYT